MSLFRSVFRFIEFLILKIRDGFGKRLLGLRLSADVRTDEIVLTDVFQNSFTKSSINSNNSANLIAKKIRKSQKTLIESRALELLCSRVIISDFIEAIPSASDIELCLDQKCINNKKVDELLCGLGEKNKQIKLVINLTNYKNGELGLIETLISRIRNKYPFQLSVNVYYSKADIWNLETYFSQLKKCSAPVRFITTDLDDEAVTIDGAFLEADETYQLAIFLHKLSATYEVDGYYRNYYKTLRNILSEEENIKYSTLQKEQWMVRVVPTPSVIEYWRTYIEEIWLKALKPENAQKVVNWTLPFYKWKKVGVSSKKTVFIVGWYGTETVGDKAILGGIIDGYVNELGSEVDFVIGSIYPYITRRTMRELGVEAKVVSTRGRELIKYSALADDVIMGGGPLMDILYLYVPLIAFYVGAKRKNKRIVYGCGLGPLNTQGSTDVVKNILTLATEISLRDSNSVELARQWGHRDVKMTGDPAKAYLLTKKATIKTNKQDNVIACFLRDIPNSFYKKMGENGFESYRENFESALASFLKYKLTEVEADKIVLYNMHNFVIGGDDRDFSRYFIEKYFEGDTTIVYDRRLSTVDSICEVMLKSKLNICMRFHSVLFADTLETDYVAIDYTDGGKIPAFLGDHGKLCHMKKTAELIEEFSAC